MRASRIPSLEPRATPPAHQHPPRRTSCASGAEQSPNSWPLPNARALRKHVNDDLGGDGPLQPSPGRGQHEGHPLGFETSRSHKRKRVFESNAWWWWWWRGDGRER